MVCYIKVMQMGGGAIVNTVDKIMFLTKQGKMYIFDIKKKEKKKLHTQNIQIPLTIYIYIGLH